ncbi:MAG TPA: dihydrodipicolinate synthase family protein [Phototrophicaceae bacterium]|nr:dihydrodipicolinate synthase family protein [Phototrophicaceae bacterium]
MALQITGVFNILATPFDRQLQIDWDSLRRLVNFQLDRGAYGLTILGVLGEAAKLSVDERRQVVETVMATVAGRVPVVVGVSHPETKTVIALSQAAFASGAAGVMIAPPRMDKPTDDQIIALYSEIAAQIDQPIVVQDFPPVNGVIMSADMLAKLADTVPNARHLKLEDPPLMEKIGAIRQRTDKYAIFGGLGGMFFLEELNRGAAGTMTGFAFTEILVAVYQAHQAGRLREAEAIFDRYLPLIRYENQPVINLTIRKELLRRRGAMAEALLRDPFAPIDAGTLAEIDELFRRVGIADPAPRIAFEKFTTQPTAK